MVARSRAEAFGRKLQPMDRPLHYEDETMRPLLRGRIHQAGVLLLAAAAFWALRESRLALAFGLVAKVTTYGASACLHVGSFRDERGVRAALTVDLLCIPMTVVGTLAPFVRGEDARREAAVGAAVVLLNAIVVGVQMRAQPGLTIQRPRVAALRVLLVLLYSVWVVVYVGVVCDFDPLWGALLALLVLCLLTYSCVHDQHTPGHVPRCYQMPWHTNRLWGYHEDMHTTTLLADALWLALAVKLT